MDKHIILSIISDDKPGIIKDLAQVIRVNGGNWLESRLSQLAGKFAGVIHVCISDARSDALRTALQDLQQRGIKVHIEDLQQTQPLTATRSARFTVVGPDRPGIVMEIAQALAQHNISVDNLNTECTSMAYSGDPLFEAEGELHIPEDASMDDVYDQLCDVADHLGMDIQLDESIERHL